MNLGLTFRDQLPAWVREELDLLVASITSLWDIEHKDDGSHGDIHATGLEVTTDEGTATLNGTGLTLATTVPIFGRNDTSMRFVRPGSEFNGTSDIYSLWAAGGGTGTVAVGFTLNLENAIVGTKASRDGNATTRISATGWNKTTGLPTNEASVVVSSTGGGTGTSVVNITGLDSVQVLSSNIGLNGVVRTTDQIYERGRTTAVGEWLNVAYNAANFAGSAGAWTVSAADQASYRISLVGKTLTVQFLIQNTDVAVGGGTLNITLPFPWVCNTTTAQPILVNNAGGGQAMGFALISSGTSVITCFATPAGGTFNFTAAGNTNVVGTLIIEVQ